MPPSLLSWPPEAIEDYRERAAIREADGRQPRARAEAAAEEDVRRWAAAGGDGALLAALLNA